MTRSPDGLPTAQDIEAALARAFKGSRADSARANVSAYRRGFVRFARNEVTTSGVVTDVRVSITVAFGQRHATTTTQSLDAASLQRALVRAETLARLAPEDPEWVGDLPPTGRSLRTAAYDPQTALEPPEARARIVEQALLACRGQKVVGAGFVTTRGGIVAVGNKKGLFHAHRETEAAAFLTARTADGLGSGWAAAAAPSAGKLDTASVIARATEKARRSHGARALPPGRYTVVLEPAATESFLRLLAFALDRRDAEEGRGAFSRGKGQTRLGERLFHPSISIYSDPADPEVPTAPFDAQGQPRKRTTWVDRGTLVRLATSRFWAKKQKIAPEPAPASLVLPGGSESLESLIRGTDKGLLITRFWYENLVDPKVLLVTGLTRDGVFAIEGGRVTYPVRNFRFNQSVLDTFRDVEAMGPAVRGGSSRWLGLRAPAMRVRTFHMSSTSEAI